MHKNKQKNYKCIYVSGLWNKQTNKQTNKHLFITLLLVI